MQDKVKVHVQLIKKMTERRIIVGLKSQRNIPGSKKHTWDELGLKKDLVMRCDAFNIVNSGD